jgi:hypothetical protein
MIFKIDQKPKYFQTEKNRRIAMYMKSKQKSNLLRFLICTILLICLTTANAFAVEGSTEVADQPEASSQEVAKVDLSNGCFIEFIAFDAESTIRDGLRLLAARCQKNIIPSPHVDGPLTVTRLYNVTFEEALEAILGIGFRYEQDGDFVKV